jgi:hypothetical protein
MCLEDGNVMQSITELALRMHESIDLTNEHEVVKFLGFIPMGENIFGVRPRTGRSMAEDAMEIGPQGVIHPRRDPYGMYICYAGTPHHSKHIFGFWHINDVDEIYINVPGATADDVGKQIIMMRYPRPGERDYFAWYCQQCSALLHCIPLDTGNLGFNSIWRAEGDAVHEFNSDPRLRICKSCGWEHWLAYRYRANMNTPEEEAARAVW